MHTFFQRAPVRLLALLCTLLALGGCAGMSARDPVRISLVGMEPLQGEGFELRFALRLRVQNPNDSDIDFDGVSVALDVNGRPFAAGVSADKGHVPRFGEAVISIPVSVPALTALRQALGFTDGGDIGRLPYVLSGKLAGGPLGTQRFSEKGTLDLPVLGSGTPLLR